MTGIFTPAYSVSKRTGSDGHLHNGCQSPSRATLDPNLFRGQQCPEARLGRRGGRAGAWYCERQSRAGRWPTAEPSWLLRAAGAVPRDTVGVQRAAVGRGGPEGADAGRAFVTVSASSASVRCPERASSVRACLSTRTAVQCPVWRL